MKRILVIGAGPAGLTAAYELLRRSGECEVTILEETDAIGGISRTVRHNGNRMDIGGHRFFSKDERVMAWWDGIMPRQGAPAYDDRKLGRTPPMVEGGPDPERADEVMLTRNRVSRIFFNHKFFDYPVKLNWNTLRNMGFFTSAEAGFSYLGAALAPRKEDSLEDFYINRFGRKLYSMFFEGYTEKLWGRHPSHISADWGAQRVKGLSVTAILKDILCKLSPGHVKNQNVETSLIEEFYYPKYGPGQLWESVAARIEAGGGEILRGRRVTGFKTDGKRIASVRVEAPAGTEEYSADAIISSMPLKDLVLGMDDAPESARAIAAGLPYRDFVTVGLLLKRLNLKNETKLKTLSNIVPDCWIYVQDTGVKLGRIQIFNNWSPYMVEKPEETIWIGLEYFCTEGDEYWSMSPKQWRDLSVRELVRMGALDPSDAPLDFHCEKVKKAYPAYFDTYDRIDELIAFLDGFENLYCVGRNGQHRYNNMDHSMLTSFAAVESILNGAPRRDIWNVNTEKEYHEEKKQ